MSDGDSRRKWIRRGLWSAAGAAGVLGAKSVAEGSGLVPPNCGNVFRPGEILTFASQRILGGEAKAREFSSAMISRPPRQNGQPPKDAVYQKHVAEGFANWKLEIGGMVARPRVLSVADVRRFPVRSQITHLACEEGWSFIAEWTGALLADVLEEVGVDGKAKFVVYHSIQPRWWDSVDMREARHAQTFLAYGMNGGDLPAGHGAPLRMRVPRQLGYKSVKYLTRLTVTDTLGGFGKGMGSNAAERGYAWYSGI
jgi:DMSO/TMAO reductase YedYZ molybdopterin-dependent catalytic subunit